MNPNTKKFLINTAISVLALVAIGLIVGIIFWPAFAFDSDAAWVGEFFWIALLATIIFIAVRAAISDENRATKARGSFNIISYKIDDRVFKNKITASLNDRSISEYFRRELVKADDVVKALTSGEAYSQACTLKSYEPYVYACYEVQETTERNIANMDDVANIRTATVLLCAPILTALLFIQINRSDFTTSGLTFASSILAGASALIFAAAKDSGNQYDNSQRRRRMAFACICACASLSAILLPPVVFRTSWIPLLGMLPVEAFCPLMFYILGSGKTLGQCVTLLGVGAEKIHLQFLEYYATTHENKWLEDCEDIIKEQATLTINSILGKDKDLLLVEQDSEGLRRLQDQSYTVSTRSERRIESVLSQMDAGSIALAGPRGAGKSTLLRKFSGQQLLEHKSPGIRLYMPAPAEYIPRDFIAAFLQQLCEAYLSYTGWALPAPIYRESPGLRSRASFRGLMDFLRLLTRTAIVIAVILWIVQTFTGTHYHHIYGSILTNTSHWGHGTYISIYRKLYKLSRPYWSWIRVVIIIITAFFFIGVIFRWAGYLKPRTEPELVNKARDYLRRLQVEKTITWGRGATIGLPSGQGTSFSLNRGGSVSYVPWTFPELVTHTRRFMKDISDQLSNLSHAIIVGIDEIDRIGSLEHAEKFIGEIKAIFGVEKCFFLVAVAEDVGSIFAQRATTGRSILENAFDDIIAVEPLGLLEARNLLQRRVPGFTDSFVYLVHALSGGLPRELIRITRRLVDVNQEVSTGSHPLRLEDLAFCLVREELIEASRATRNQLARLILHANWTAFFEKVQSVSVILRYASPFSMNQSHIYIKELSELVAPDAPEGVQTVRDLIVKDEDEASRIVRDFAAFSFFGLTIIDAFSDRYFDFEAIRISATSKSRSQYEELAVARAELNVSPENSRAMLNRFRNRLHSP